MTQRILFTPRALSASLAQRQLGQAKNRRRAPGSGRGGNYGDLSEPICPAEAQPAALENILKRWWPTSGLISLANSYSPGIRADGHVGAVSLHRSQEGPGERFRWQGRDETWSAGYDAVAESCDLRVEDFGMYILTAH